MLDTGQAGKAGIGTQEAQSHQEILDMVDRLEMIEGVKRGIQDVDGGKTKSLAQVDAEMREKHGIPR